MRGIDIIRRPIADIHRAVTGQTGHRLAMPTHWPGMHVLPTWRRPDPQAVHHIGGGMPTDKGHRRAC